MALIQTVFSSDLMVASGFGVVAPTGCGVRQGCTRVVLRVNLGLRGEVSVEGVGHFGLEPFARTHLGFLSSSLLRMHSLVDY